MVYTAEPLEYPEGTTLPELLLERNVNNVPPDMPAIIDGVSGATVYNYSSFRATVRRVANYLCQDINLPRGAVVGILAANSNNYPVIVHGILAAGGVVSAFNPLHQAQEILHYLRIARPKVVLVDQHLTKTLTDGLSRAKLDYSPDLYVLSPDSSHPAPWIHFDLGHIIATGAEKSDTVEPRSNTTRSDLAFLCFSSGTTGPMKGVYLTHENIITNIFQHRQRLPEMFQNHQTVAALITPFFHILGLGGIPIVVFPNFELPLLLDAIPRDRTTTTSTTDFSSLRGLINAAAPLKEIVSSELSRRMGCNITQWYGMTEASPSVISQREDEVEITGTVGRLLPGMSMKIVDSEGEECEPNKPGELLIQGSNLMSGYVQNTESNDAFIDGYFKTGDIGYVNEAGYVFLVGRSKELIKVKGHQVAPADLESILLSHPKVCDAAVKGVYFPEQETEYPAAYITIDSAQTEPGQLQAEVEAFVNNQVAKYKWLRSGVHIIPAIPRK
ncbi:uncharacterized protein N7525_010225 [Penicillium rubens]|uniref:uncharacterized protein n=1 Tax=Penicillium rubens TaxID=1108849 RepID=UPI002A5A7698|nr:uncharacterized protein N7525_010225 [Penicillium rubens]KAJ5820941.1 hypothetical protein N7525_010225 [Penicillium rubens]